MTRSLGAQDALSRPAHAEPVVEAILGDLRSCSPLPQRQALAPILDAAGSTGVVGLIDAIRPATVSRLIVALVVDSLERETWRPRPHISEEALKALPSVTDSDATPGVERPTRAAAAPLEHGYPTPVRRRTRLPVCPTTGARDLQFVAPAGAGGPSIETSLLYRDSLAALATTGPFSGIAGFLTGTGTNHGQATVDRTGEGIAQHDSNIATPAPTEEA